MNVYFNEVGVGLRPPTRLLPADITRHLAKNMFLAQCSLILNLVPWMLFALDPLDNFSDLTTSFLGNQALATTGPKAITQKVLN